MAVSDFIEATLRIQRDFAWRRKVELRDYLQSLEQGPRHPVQRIG